MSDLALVPSGLAPDDIVAGYAEAALALIRANDDPEWLWNSARAAAIYAQVWAGHAEKRGEMEAAQLLCEIQLGQVLGEPPGAGGDHGNQHTGGKVANSRDYLPPAYVVKDLRRLHGYADRLNDAVLGSLEHARRVISRRALVALADAYRQRDEQASDEPAAITPSVATDIRRGDFREVLADLDGTVDAIITDPPYERAALPLYADLSRFAARALRPGGSLVVMVGQSYLPEVLAALASAVTYRWTLAYMLSAGNVQVWPPRMLTAWKPIVWLTNGSVSGSWRSDVVRPTAELRQAHRWQQSEDGMDALVERFSRAGDLVCDPFLGGGTTGVVAVRGRRRFVGAEIDVCHAERAAQRIWQEALLHQQDGQVADGHEVS